LAIAPPRAAPPKTPATNSPPSRPIISLLTSGLEGTPILAIFDSAGNLHYAGGYYDHPSAVNPLDEDIHLRFLAHTSSEALPVFGCAVSPRLKKSLNPLRFLPDE
jgi:hypothetical protein